MNSNQRPATKTCTICLKEKDIGDFSKGRSQCKPCRSKKELERYNGDEEYRERAKARKREYHHTNRDRMNKISREYYLANREQMIQRQIERDSVRYEDKLEYERNRYASDKDRIKAVQKAWRKKNRGKINARDARRRAALLQATPPWANLKKIERTYQLAAWASRFTDEPLHVDHIEPLQGKDRCGLHVENNLQILPASENLRKSNKTS